MDEQNERYLEIADYGDRAIVRRPDGRQVALPFHKFLETSAVFGQPVTAIRNATTTLASVAAQSMPNLTSRGWQENFANTTGKPLFRAASALHRVALSQFGELDGWRARTIKSANPVDPVIASEARAWLRSLKLGEAAKAALQNRTIAEAALAAWNLTNLPDSLRPQVEDALIRSNLVASYSHAFKLKPDAANPFATGPDIAAAERAADEAFVLQKAAYAELETAQILFGNALDFAAIAGDVPRAAAFNMIAEAA